jgi:transcriptional regulator with XRE-family HTH domain
MKLGELVGVTYQQVQKYERGEDRITVERLRQISQALRIPTSSLLSGIPPAIHEFPPAYLKLGDLTPEETSLIQAFRRIQDPVYRKLIFRMAALGSRVSPKKA